MDTVVLSTSSTENFVHVFDMRTAAQLMTYKNSLSNPNCITTVGADYVLTVQNNRPGIHAWLWGKDQILLKSSTPEIITCIAASHDGSFCAGGGTSGKVYVWQVVTGALVAVFDAHYKQLSAITFTSDDSHIVTGGEDAIVNVWPIASVMSAGDAAPPTLHSWSEHTLTVTSVVCGQGGVSSRVVSGSLDRTCKVWDMVSGGMLASVVFPAHINAVAIDPGESYVFAGAGDGRIYVLSLYASEASFADLSAEPAVLEGHSEAVLCLAVSPDGHSLVSGGQDGRAIVWDVRSGQQAKLYGQHRGPVTGLVVLPRPADVYGDRKDKKRMLPIEVFRRYIGAEVGGDAFGPCVPTMLGGFADDEDLAEEDDRLQNLLSSLQGSRPEESSAEELLRLKQEVIGLQDESDRWKDVNTKLYQHCVNRMLPGLSAATQLPP